MPPRHTSHLKHLGFSPCFFLSASREQGENSTGKGQLSGRFSYIMGSDFFFLLQESFRSNGYITLFGFQTIINDSKTKVPTSQLFLSHNDLFRLQKGWLKQTGTKYLSKSQTKPRPELSYYKPEVTGLVSVFLCWGERGGLNRLSREDFFSSSGNAPYDTITVDRCHCTFVQTRRMYNTKREL